MKLSAVNNLPLCTSCKISLINFYSSLFDIFNKEGWALHTRSRFRFNDKKKTLLRQYFKDGDKSGKKKKRHRKFICF